MTAVDFWFDFASTYSYPAAMRVGPEVRWRPFLLGPIFFEQQGIQDSPFNVNPVRGRYMWRDLERICARHGLPWRKPSAFPRNSTLAAKVACAVEGEPWLPAYFGAPTFVVGTELFFGQDRMDDALEWARGAAARPAPGPAPTPGSASRP